MFAANANVIPSGLLNAWHVLVWTFDNPNMILVWVALCWNSMAGTLNS